MLGRGPLPTAEVHSRTAVTWTRDYALQGREDCAALRLALAAAGMQRMVVGHTIQDEGIRSACAQRVYCIDVGLSRGCTDGSPEVLEIIDDKCVWGNAAQTDNVGSVSIISKLAVCARGPNVALTQFVLPALQNRQCSVRLGNALGGRTFNAQSRDGRGLVAALKKTTQRLSAWAESSFLRPWLDDTLNDKGTRLVGAGLVVLSTGCG
jgi:hypothetical protein